MLYHCSRSMMFPWQQMLARHLLRMLFQAYGHNAVIFVPLRVSLLVSIIFESILTVV